MESQHNTVLCISCLDSTSPNDRCSLYRKVKIQTDSTSNIEQNLIGVLQNIFYFRFNDENFAKKCFVCHKCFTKLCTLERYYKNLMNVLKPDSYLQVRIAQTRSLVFMANTNSLGTASTGLIDHDYSKHVQNVVTPKKYTPSTPVFQKLLRSRKSAGGRITVSYFGHLQVKQELSILSKQPVFREFMPNGQFELKDFWENVTNDMKYYAPTTLRIMQGMICLSPKKPSLALPPIEPNKSIGVALCVLLKERSQLCSYFQKLIALMLCSHQAPIEVYTLLNKLNLSVSYSTMLRMIHALSVNYDAKMWEWKKDVEDAVNALPQPATVETPKRPVPKKRRRLIDDFNSTDIDGWPVADYVEVVTTADKLPEISPRKRKINSYLHFGDNCNRTINPHSSYSGNSTSQWSGFASGGVLCRIPQLVSNFVYEPTITAPEIPFTEFIVNCKDKTLLLDEWQYLIQKKLCTHLQVFKSLSRMIRQHMDHPYWEESIEKSEVVNLGCLNENENSKEGMLKIIRYVETYAPEIDVKLPNGQVLKRKLNFITYGDGLTCQRVSSTIKSQSVQESKESKITNIWPGLGYWHFKVSTLDKYKSLLLNDIHATSGVGTLPYMRVKYGHTGVKQKINACVNPTINLHRFALDAYLCAVACQQLGITDISADLELTLEERLAKLKNVTNYIINNFFLPIWSPLERKFYCSCKRTVEQDAEDRRTNDPAYCSWIMCENPCCTISWFHESCVRTGRKGQFGYARVPREVRVEETDEDFFVENEDSAFSIHYKELEEDEIVEAVVEEEKKPKKKRRVWFCTADCKKSYMDRKYQYSKCVIYAGLMHEGMNDALRSNDAERILMHTKCNLLLYSNFRAPTYFALIVRHLICMTQAVPGNIKHDLKYNSTVNIQGRPLGNIEMDLCNEFFVNHCKRVIKGIRGAGVASKIERATRALSVVKELGNLVQKELTLSDTYVRKSKDRSAWSKDLSKCVMELLSENLVTDLRKDRSHPGFKDFGLEKFFIQNLDQFKLSIKKCRNDFEFIRQNNVYDGTNSSCD